MIPRLIHRIWLGGPMPEQNEAWGRTWTELNPGWTMVTWDEAMIDQFDMKCRAEFEAAESYAQKADLARYEILYRMGGLYVDTDFECLKPISVLLKTRKVVLGWEDKDNPEGYPDVLSNAFIAAPQQHRLLRWFYEAAALRFRADPGGSPAAVTGPAMVTEETLRFMESWPDKVLLLPREQVFPYGAWEPERRHGPFPDAYAVHHWDGSWCNGEE